MSTPTSNKRQRMESPVQYEPYDTEDIPHDTDLSEQPLTRYEDNPTEAQITEIVGKLDEPDVRTLLTNAIKDLDEADVRKFLINAAVSNELVYMDLWGELTHIQLAKKDAKMQKIVEQHCRPIEFGSQGRQPQKAAAPKQPKPPMTRSTESLDTGAHIQRVDYLVNHKYAELSRSKQYDKTANVAELVNAEITELAKSVTKNSSHTTKIDAVLGLCQIGIIIARGGGCIGTEIHKLVGHDDLLIRIILGIADLMTAEEKRVLSAHDLEALEAFDKERKIHRVFNTFQQVLDTFKNAPTGT